MAWSISSSLSVIRSRQGRNYAKMKTSAFFISSSLFLFSCLINVLLAEGFADTCDQFSLDQNSPSEFYATCGTDGPPTPDDSTMSGLDLNHCLEYSGGYLFGNPKLVYPTAVVRIFAKRYSGDYSASCGSCSLTGSWIMCDCRNPDVNTGGTVKAAVDLGQFFNTLGFLNYCTAS